MIIISRFIISSYHDDIDSLFHIRSNQPDTMNYILIHGTSNLYLMLRSNQSSQKS